MNSTTGRLWTLALGLFFAAGCGTVDDESVSTGDNTMLNAGPRVGTGGMSDGRGEGDDLPGDDEVMPPSAPMGGSEMADPNSETPEPAPEPPAGNCDRTGFQAGMTQAVVESFGMQYTAEGGTPMGSERFWVQIYSGFDGPTQPGRYTVENENFADCGLCLLAFADCNAEGCERTFYADNATVNITALDGPGGRFAATVESAVFQEVNIEQETYRSVPVPGGDSWCIGDYEFDEAVNEAEAPDTGPAPEICGQPGVNCVGDTIPDFELLNCESGEMESIQTNAEGEKAIWMVMTAGWCPACADWLTQVSMIASDPMAQGIEFVFVFGENNARGEPNLRECQQYARQYGGAANFYIDHDGQDSFRTTFTNIWPYLGPNGEFGLPWNAVLNAETMEYVHGDNAGTDLQQALLSLLQ